jgi:predicted ATPase
METIRIERLRCLEDTGDVQIRPLTLIVGQNSSGKSSFLRIFPLLRQSTEARTTGPFLWNGHLVDFGSFEEAHQNGAEEGIRLSFKFKISGREDPRFFYAIESSYPLMLGAANIIPNSSLYLSMKLVLSKEERTHLNQLSLQLEDSKINLEFREDNSVSAFQVNSLDVLKLGAEYVSSKTSGSSFIPTITEVAPKKETDTDISRIVSRIVGSRYSLSKTLLEKLIVSTQKNNHHGSKLETVLRMALTFAAGESEEMLKNIQNNRYGRNTWKKKTNSWTTDDMQFQELQNLIIANAVPLILERCDDLITGFSRRVSYIGPVRATASRFYRMQDLAVDEVDPQGVNLPMFLRNLTDSEMQRFSDWTSKNFGFRPLLKSTFGLLSLKIKPNNSDREFNVSDTGFGVSQVLPVITQLWFLSERYRSLRKYRQGTYTFTIEQPELHLHPKLQGRLADTFVESLLVAKRKNIDLKIVIETHSETLINRLGYLVTKNKISKDDISIVLFDACEQDGVTKTRTSHFNQDGYLIDWPIGFFDLDFESGI